MVVIRATSVFLFLGLAACSVGEVPIGGGTPVDAPAGGTDGPPVTIDAPPANDPAASFEALVKPLVTSSGCLGCHPNLSKPNFESFSTLETSYLVKPGTNSVLVTRGPHPGTTFFDDAEKQIVSDWLDSLPAR